jgi:CheY-like chemotaxis protein
MAGRLRVLLVEDNAADAEIMAYELRRAGFDLDWERVDTEPGYLAGLARNPDLILADYTLPQFSALQSLELLAERGLDIPCIVVTGPVGEEAAVECLRCGATDYLLKDRLTRLGQAVAQALQARELRAAKWRAEQTLRDSEERYRRIVETAGEGIWAVDAGYRTTFVNANMAAMLGYAVEELAGRAVFEFMDPELRCRFHGTRTAWQGSREGDRSRNGPISARSHSVLRSLDKCGCVKQNCLLDRRYARSSGPGSGCEGNGTFLMKH